MKEFTDLDLTGAVFRDVDLSDARMSGVVLAGADIDGYIVGLRLNGVDVAPLVEAELNRLHPERAKLRPTTADGVREAWTVVEAMWTDTMEAVRSRPEADLHRSVNGEWSFVETLRHLVFVIDAWFAHAVLGESRPFHPLGLPATFTTDAASFGIDSAATPGLEDVMAVRTERIATVRAFVDTVTQEELDRVREPNTAPGLPPPASRTALSCLHVVFNEEWTHRSFALRDLAILDQP